MYSQKHKLADLALFGGPPVSERLLHVGKPNMPDRSLLMKQLEDVLDSGWLTNNGPMVREFEEHIRELLGVRNCVAVSNGTTGLEIATRALGLTGEVIVPAFTFVATAHCLQWQGIKPVFCDVDPVSGCIDPSLIDDLVTPETTGILGVHLWGRPCAVEELEAAAERNGLKLVLDAAHSFGCTHRGRYVGGFGAAEVFSFHATKFLSTMEGGLIATDDDALAEKMRLMRNFGFKGMDNVIHIGTNGKMNEFSAAFGLASLTQMEHVISKNRENHFDYRSGLESVPGITLRDYPDGEKHNYQYVIAEVDARETGLARDDLIRILHAENIRARRYFHPGCHRMEPYITMYPEASRDLPNTELLASRVIALPTGTSVSSEDIRSICSLLAFVQKNSIDVAHKMKDFQI